MKKISRFIAVTTLAALCFGPVVAQEAEQPKEKQTAPEKAAPDKKADKKKQENNKENSEGPILKNPALADEFRLSYSEHDPVSHSMVYFMYGLVSGGIIGMGGGLSFYTSSTDLSPLYITAIATGGVGGITGVIISIIENARENPYSIGRPFFEYSWYGTFAGALTGGLVGLIPLAVNNDTTTMLNIIGYGTLAGLATGIALYFIIPPKNLKNLILDSNGLETRAGYRFQF